jgi:hypothetical protein
LRAEAEPNNGDFEAGNTSFWNVYSPDGQPYQWNVTTVPSNVHSGTYAGALTQFGGTNSPLYIVSGSVDTSLWPTGSLCLGTLYLKTENLQLADPRQSLRVILIFWDANYQNVVGYYYQNGNFLGSHSYLPVQVLGNVPPGAKWVQFQLVLNSGITSGAVYVDDAEIHRQVSPGNLSTNIPECRVLRDTNGSPRLYINGVVQNPSFFFGNSGHPVIYDEMKLAANAGVNLIQVPLGSPWFGLGSGMIEQTLQANSNAWILPRIGVYPPDWWLNTHSNQLLIDEKGQQISDLRVASLASEQWLQDAKDQLEQCVRYFHNSPYRSRIIGYHITYLNTGEWFYPDTANHFWDYSEVNRQRFVTWLQSRYADIAALNATWHKSYASFDAVQIPSTNDWFSADDGVFRNPASQRAAPDYAEYHNQLVAERIAELAAHIKTLTSGKSLVAAFYGYTAELVSNGGHRGTANSGHLALKRLLASPDMDILCSPVSYYDRQVGGPANMMAIVDTVMAAGKLYLQEDDSNTYLVNPANNPDNWNPWYSNEWDTAQCLRRDYGNVIGHNQAMWWMDLWADGRFNTNSIWTNNALVMRTYDDVIARQQPFQPQIAVLFDEETPFWLTADVYHLTYLNTYDIRSLFQKCGASVAYYFIEDLPKIPASARLLVFANTHRFDAAEQMLISEAKTNGRTFLWLYAPGYVNETNLSVSGMEAATGFKFVRNPNYTSVSMRVTSSNSPVTADLPNHQFGSGNFIAPNFYVDASVGSPEVLGRYFYNNQPGFVVKDYGTWKSVFSGGLNLTVQMLRSIARYAGVNLLAEGDTLDATNAVNFIGDYMYVYAMNNAGRRCFQLPGEKVPNGNFEKFTGAFPTTGFGRWISPSYGSLPPCRVINTNAAAGSNACATGPFVSSPGQYSEPLAIRLQAEQGKTYRVSCSVYVDGLNPSSATNGNYIYFVFQPHDWSPDSWTAIIAQGTNSHMSNGVWTKMESSFTFTGSAAPYQNELFIVLKVYGAYSVNNLLIDNVSVRESDCEPVDVFDLTQNVSLGTGVTSWAADFALNEQKIFRLTPTISGACNITDVQLIGPNLLQIQWRPVGESYRYTVEESAALPPDWQAASGTNIWPITQTQAAIPISGSKKFFRVKAERF